VKVKKVKDLKLQSVKPLKKDLKSKKDLKPKKVKALKSNLKLKDASFVGIKQELATNADEGGMVNCEKAVKAYDLDYMVTVFKQEHPILSKLQIQTIAFLLN
jgi:hypothetical protein